MTKKPVEHKTTHSISADGDGAISVWCLGCKWRDSVDVRDLSYVDAMNAIFAARDAHELEQKGVPADSSRPA
jgi:hypothetical protein